MSDLTEKTEEQWSEFAESWAADSDAHISSLCRDWMLQITGTNCTFVDDDLRVLAHLADKAVKAGLTEGLPASMSPFVATKLGDQPK